MRESITLDFKEKVDFDSDEGKTKFLDDVAALANAVGGAIVVSVKQDEKGGFHGYRQAQRRGPTISPRSE